LNCLTDSGFWCTLLLTLAVGDVNGDGRIGMAEAMMVLRKVGGFYRRFKPAALATTLSNHMRISRIDFKWNWRRATMRRHGATAILTILTLAAGTAWAAPALISYQGKLVDNTSGEPLAGPVALTFRVFDAASGGTLLWEEVHAAVALDAGIQNANGNPNLIDGNTAYGNDASGSGLNISACSSCVFGLNFAP